MDDDFAGAQTTFVHLSTYYLNFQIIFLEVIVDHDGGKGADGAGSTAAGVFFQRFRDQVLKCTNRRRRWSKGRPPRTFLSFRYQVLKCTTESEAPME